MPLSPLRFNSMNSNSGDKNLTSITLPNFGGRFYIAIAGIDCTLGILINGWSFWVIAAGGWSLTEAECLTLNTVILKIVYNLSFTLVLYTYFNRNAALLALFFQHGTTFSARSLLLCYMCMERYVAVVIVIATSNPLYNR